MSWDVLLLNSKTKVPLDNGLNNKSLPSFGSRFEFVEKFNLLYPETDWNDPYYGILENDDYAGYISLGGYLRGSEQLDNSIVLHIHGGKDPMEVIINICVTYNCQAYDMGIGRYIYHDES